MQQFLFIFIAWHNYFIQSIDLSIKTHFYSAVCGERIRSRRMLTETRPSVYSRCTSGVKELSFYGWSSEQFSRTTIVRQWVPDWRSTDAENTL